MKYIYKNTSDRKLIIPGVGIVDPGKNIASEAKLNNANLEEVKEERSVTKESDKEKGEKKEVNKDKKE